MRYGLILTSAIAYLIMSNTWAINPNDLVKVDATTNAKCVEYYHYQNELYCATRTHNNGPASPGLIKAERQKIVFDERPWLVAWGKIAPNITTIEYVPAGDSINNWNELITTQFIPYSENIITLKAYVDNVLSALKKSGFDPIINIIKETPDQVLFEFRVVSPQNFQQDELQLVTKSKNGFYVLHYVIKQPDMGAKQREKWVKNLLASQIVK